MRQRVFSIVGVACIVCIAACTGTGSRNSPATRYEGILLDARNLGAGQVTREAASDPTVKAYVAQHGNPDFVLVGSTTELELVYGAPINPVGPNCWTVAVADQSCRTCCLGAGACSVQCTAKSS